MRAILLLLALLLVGCSQSQANTPASTPVARPTAAPIYVQLRQQVLELDPADIGLTATADGPAVWAILMEMWLPEATATLVSVADGTTSLYFSDGGGIIGGGESPEIAAASLQFVAATDTLLSEFTPTVDFPMPDEGRVTFYALTYDGAYRADVAQEELQAGDHALSPLYAMGQNVIAQVRLRADDQE